MSEFNSYAVLGAGLVGNAFITALLTTKPNASIVILSRSATKSSTLPAEIANNPHIKTVVVDYSSVSSVSTALKEHAIEVVVDTVQIYDEAFDNPLADAAKEAGTLKLFVPSEFGFVSENATMYPLNTKGATQEHVKSIGLPFVVINVGLFIDFIPFVAYAELGKFHIVWRRSILRNRCGGHCRLPRPPAYQVPLLQARVHDLPHPGLSPYTQRSGCQVQVTYRVR